MKTKFSLLIILSLLSFNLFSQHHNHNFITLNDRIEEATLIIEGEVIDKESFFDADKREIYTVNTIKIYKQFKGNYEADKFYIVTLGGEFGDYVEYVTHSFQLDEHDNGIFFLKDNYINQYLTDIEEEKLFSIHNLENGFLRLNEKRKIENIFEQHLNVERDIFQKIETKTGTQRIIKNYTKQELSLQNWINQQTSENNSIENSIESIVEYTIENPSLTGALNQYLEFDINIASLLASEEFFSGEILIDYNDVTFGSNIASNGILTVTQGTVILTPNYTITLTDITPSQLKIEVTSNTNNPNSLYLITSSSEELVHFKIDLTNIVGNTGIDFDEINMQGFSEFFDVTTNVIEPFDLVKAEDELDIDVSGVFTPQIDSIRPLILRGGTGDTLKIYGNNFGTILPTSYSTPHKVEFRNALSNSGWMRPNYKEYISWTNNLITLYVPSVGRNSSGTNSSWGNYIAGTGPIRVTDITGNSQESSDTLIVKYSVANNSFVNNQDLPLVLVDRNDRGGYTLTYDSSFVNLQIPPDSGDLSPIQAFDRALVAWRCSTGLNFIVNDNIPNLSIEPEPAPVDANQMLVKVIYSGIDAVARARMLIFRNCNVNGFRVKGYVEKFTIEFNGNKSWTTFSSTNNIIDFTQVDLESVALHELGHTHLLNHSNNKFPSTTSLNGNLMYWRDVYFTRVIDPWSLEGGNYVMSISTVATPNVDSSCLNPMEAVPSLHCQIITDTKEELKNENLITVFPNPSSHQLNIQLLKSETVNFYLYNSVGQLIRKEQFVGAFYNLNINYLPSGIYFLNIQISNELKTYKVVKQ